MEVALQEVREALVSHHFSAEIIRITAKCCARKLDDRFQNRGVHSKKSIYAGETFDPYGTDLDRSTIAHGPH